MYYLNRTLIERLPKMLHISQQTLCERLGIDRRQYIRWTKENGRMKVQMLVRLSNVTRISLSEFIVVSEKPVQRPSADSYVIPADRWTEVRWDGNVMLSLFGQGGSLGVTKADVAERLGLGSPQDMDRWASGETAMDINVLINMLNEFHLDASMFFDDGNGAIPVPLWDPGDKHVAEILEDKLQRFRRLEISSRNSERRAAGYRLENERLKRENEALSARMEVGADREPQPAYRSLGGRTEWAFNKSLWQALPEMFEMTKTEFCRNFGFGQASDLHWVDNIKTSTLVQVCNTLRISISHFFIPKGKAPVIQDRIWYEVSRHVFRPIQSRMEIMNYLFGRWSVFGYNVGDFNRQTGMRYKGLKTAADDERSRVITLADICSEFNLSPMLFFDDPNRKDDLFIMNRYEKLILNAVDMAKEIEALRAKNRRLKEKLKALGKEDAEGDE